MSQIADISPTLKGTAKALSSLTADGWEQLYLRPLAVLYLQEAAKLSHMEKQEVSPWTLSLHNEHVRLLEKQFLRYVRKIRRQHRAT